MLTIIKDLKIESMKKYRYYRLDAPAHKSDFTPKFKGKKATPSLEEAIIYFTLSCCVKRIRNKESLKHNSMMIHATRFNDVQSEIVIQVDDFVQKLKSTQYGWLDEYELKIKQVWDGYLQES